MGHPEGQGTLFDVLNFSGYGQVIRPSISFPEPPVCPKPEPVLNEQNIPRWGCVLDITPLDNRLNATYKTEVGVFQVRQVNISGMLKERYWQESRDLAAVRLGVLATADTRFPIQSGYVLSDLERHAVIDTSKFEDYNTGGVKQGHICFMIKLGKSVASFHISSAFLGTYFLENRDLWAFLQVSLPVGDPCPAFVLVRPSEGLYERPDVWRHYFN